MNDQPPETSSEYAEFLENYQATERGSRLSIVITKDMNHGRSKFEIEHEDGEREIVEIDTNSNYEDDAVASNFIAGMPLFAATPKNCPDQENEDGDVLSGLPPPTVGSMMPIHSLNVHSLLNLDDDTDETQNVHSLLNLNHEADADDDDDDGFALKRPEILSPSSASISKAFQKFNFSPSPAPRRSVSASPSSSSPSTSSPTSPTTPPSDLSRTPLPSVTEDPTTPVKSPFTFPEEATAQIASPASFFQTASARPSAVSAASSTPDSAVTRATSLSVYVPATDKPRADLTSIGELHVHDAGDAAVVTQVTRTAHVSFDSATGKYDGLPVEWAAELQKAFGLPLQLSASMTVPGYSGRLPPVLVQMKQYLVEHGGLEQRGIFRLAPEGNEASLVKAQLNAGTFTGCSDVNVIANLLKVWFRDMPLRLLDSVRDSTLITSCETAARAGKVIMTQYRDPHLTLMLWLLDLCADVCERAEVNMMSPQNMAIVFAPNLFKLADSGVESGMDPIKLMSLCKKYTLFLAKAIEWRMGTRA